MTATQRHHGKQVLHMPVVDLHMAENSELQQKRMTILHARYAAKFIEAVKKPRYNFQEATPINADLPKAGT